MPCFCKKPHAYTGVATDGGFDVMGPVSGVALRPLFGCAAIGAIDDAFVRYRGRAESNILSKVS